MFFSKKNYSLAITMCAEQSKAYVCSRSLVEIVGSNPAEGMDVCCECCVLSGRSHCDELITHPVE